MPIPLSSEEQKMCGHDCEGSGRCRYFKERIWELPGFMEISDSTFGSFCLKLTPARMVIDAICEDEEFLPRGTGDNCPGVSGIFQNDKITISPEQALYVCEIYEEDGPMCRYLYACGKRTICAKLIPELKAKIDKRYSEEGLEENPLYPQGNNCPGLKFLRRVRSSK